MRFGSVTEFAEAFRAAASAWGRANQALAIVPGPDRRAIELERKRRLRRRNWRVAVGTAAMVVAIVLLAENGATHLIATGRAWSAMATARFRSDRGESAQVRPSQPESHPVPRAEPAAEAD